ncbi:16254_t:CDS:2, partial [Dentiscutata erythropus]
MAIPNTISSTSSETIIQRHEAPNATQPANDYDPINPIQDITSPATTKRSYVEAPNATQLANDYDPINSDTGYNFTSNDETQATTTIGNSDTGYNSTATMKWQSNDVTLPVNDALGTTLQNTTPPATTKCNNAIKKKTG